MWLLVLSSMSFTAAYAQSVEPPSEADEFGWLRWAVIVLLGIVLTGSGTFFASMKSSYESRISDKDQNIERLLTQVTELQITINALQSDKDTLNKDMQDKVIPALTSASDLIRTFLNGVTRQ